jgi:hypothetical protein
MTQGEVRRLAGTGREFEEIHRRRRAHEQVRFVEGARMELRAAGERQRRGGGGGGGGVNGGVYMYVYYIQCAVVPTGGECIIVYYQTFEATIAKVYVLQCAVAPTGGEYMYHMYHGGGVNGGEYVYHSVL